MLARMPGMQNSQTPLNPEQAPAVSVVAWWSFWGQQTSCGSLLRTGYLVGLWVFPARDQQHLFLQYFGRSVLVPGQNQEVQKHMKTNNTLKRFSQIIQSSRKQEIIQQY